MLLDYVVCISQRCVLPLFFLQEVHQVLRTHKARRFSVLPVDHVYFLPMSQQVIEMFDLLSGQVPRIGFVAFL